MKKRPVGQPRKNKKLRMKISVSIDPDKLKKIKKAHPKVSTFIDQLLAEYLAKQTMAA